VAYIADPAAQQKKEPELSWRSERLDGGRMLLLKISLSASVVRDEILARLRELGAKSPPKGFRAGRVAESVLRRVHGKKVTEAARKDLLDRSYRIVFEEHTKKGIRIKTTETPTINNMIFSETEGLSYEILLTGLEPSKEDRQIRSDIVDMRGGPTKT